MAEKIITDKDYLFLSAMLKAREAKMLGAERMDRMLAAPSFEEAAKLLTDCGYEDMSAANMSGVDEALSRRRKAAFDEIAFSIPDKAALDIFRIKYDYHNIKTLVKSRAVGAAAEHLYSEAGRIDIERLQSAYDEEDYRFLPPRAAEALRESRGILARTGNPQLSDFETDRVYFEELAALSKASGSVFLEGYARLLVDSANLRSVVRCARMGKDQDFLLSALVPGGSTSPERLAQAAAAGGEAVAAAFAATPLKEAGALGAEAMQGGDMTAFELACDNGVSAYLARAKTRPFGVEPVVEYLALLESEITAVRMILTGRLAGIAPEVIRERLRDISA